MKYVLVPREVSVANITSNRAAWAAGVYRHVEIPTTHTKRVGDLLQEWENGCEVGAPAEVQKSDFLVVRTKALQQHSFVAQLARDAVGHITPKAYTAATARHPARAIKDGDILYARGGSVGEVALALGCGAAIPSGHMLRLQFKENGLYCLAFMKHEICKLQQRTQVTGAIHALDNFKIDTLLNCLIPFPAQRNAERVVDFISALTQAIVDKEQAIRARSEAILATVTAELLAQQRSGEFRYAYPTLSEVKTELRFDAAVYSRELKSKLWLVQNYTRGHQTPSAAGFTITPGPSLEIKLLRTRIDSATPRPGYYALFLPTNISPFGTMYEVPYLGTPKTLPLLRQGDILFGEAGFQKGRSIVLVDGYPHATTNAHGIYARRADGDLGASVFFRCIFHWYRSMRLIDLLAVGGSGGHFSPSYFDSLLIPSFPDNVRQKVVSLYHAPAPPPKRKPDIAGLVDWHRSWNTQLGIWELDREMKALQRTLSDVQEQIINGKTVHVPLNGV